MFIGVVSIDFQGLMFRSETFISEEFCLSGGDPWGDAPSVFRRGNPSKCDSIVIHFTWCYWDARCDWGDICVTWSLPVLENPILVIYMTMYAFQW